MRLLHSAALRAICSIIVGVLMLIYPVETEKWISVVVGILFIIPGIASIIAFYIHRNDKAPENHRPMFPLAGWGSLLLGTAILIFHSQTEQTAFILMGVLLVILSISLMVSLLMSKKFYKISFAHFIIPIIVLIIGAIAVLFNNQAYGNFITPDQIFQVIGVAFILYGLADLYCSIRITTSKRQYHKRLRQEETAKAQAEKESAENGQIQEALGEQSQSAPKTYDVEPETQE